MKPSSGHTCGDSGHDTLDLIQNTMDSSSHCQAPGSLLKGSGAPNLQCLLEPSVTKDLMTTHLEFNTECRVRAIGDHEGGSGDEEDDDGFWDDEDLSKDKKGRRRITLRRKTARWTKAQVVLFRATILAIIFMIVEVVGGYISESVAIISDAAHMFSDVSGYIIALAAAFLSNRGISKKYPYGYKRIEVLGALISVLFIWFVTAWLVYEAICRLVTPQEVNHKVMVTTAALGIIFNVCIFWVLGAQHHHHYGMPCTSHHGHGHACSLQSHGQSYSKPVGELSESDSSIRQEETAAALSMEGGCFVKDNCHAGHTSDHGDHHHSEHKNGAEGGCNGHGHSQDRKHAGGCSVHFHDQTCNIHGHKKEQAVHKPCHGHGHIHSSDCHGHKHHDHGHSLLHKNGCNGINGHNHVHKGDCDGHRSCGTDDHHQGSCNGHHTHSSHDHPIRTRRCGGYHAHSTNDHQRCHGGRRGGCDIDHENLNVRGAVLHALGDLLQSIGVLIAGIIMWAAPRCWWADPVATLFFSIIVFWTTRPLVMDISAILMQRAPKSVCADTLEEELLGVPGAACVERLSVWSLSSSHHVMSVHVKVADGCSAAAVLRSMEAVCKLHNISDTTIQVDLL